MTVAAIRRIAVPSPEELIDRARHLVPEIRALAEETERNRYVLPHIIWPDADDGMSVTGEDNAPPGLGLRVRAEAEPAPDRRKVAPRHVVGVAGKILVREFTVPEDDPIAHAADDFDAAFTTVEKHVEVPGDFPQIFAQRGCLRVEGGKHQSLVAVQ